MNIILVAGEFRKPPSDLPIYAWGFRIGATITKLYA
jgi:hypothetical protein